MVDHFVRNMHALSRKAGSDGYTPVVTNCYARNDFTPEDYQFIKEMNLKIHQWNVPSINLLGAIDDLSGHWMDGFWAAGFHPNDEGHEEMAYIIVPSLFDALTSGHPSPVKVAGPALKLSKTQSHARPLVLLHQKIHHSLIPDIHL